MQALKYSTVDELERILPPEGQASTSGCIIEMRTLGPAIYFCQSCQVGLISSYARKLVSFGRYATFGEFFRNPAWEMFASEDRSFAVARATARAAIYDQMCQYALTAVKNSALARNEALQVISAIGELHGNVIDHSGNLCGALYGYEVTHQYVGIYVSDLGAGSLATLNKNPRFANLTDHADSLKLCVQEGVSSKTEVGRGLGFRPIFHGLAERAGYIRLRSGDGLLEVSGVNFQAPTFGLSERPSIPGFHVNVHCQLIS